MAPVDTPGMRAERRAEVLELKGNYFLGNISPANVCMQVNNKASVEVINLHCRDAPKAVGKMGCQGDKQALKSPF